jgi:RimJ/RimL family protein N-acetyltransferase
MIDTARLRLRAWHERDRVDFAAMNADPDVMRDLGGPLTADASHAKFDRYMAAFAHRGFGRWYARPQH